MLLTRKMNWAHSSPALILQCWDEAVKPCPHLKSFLGPWEDWSGASRGLRSHRSSAGSFLHHQETWARTQAMVEPSGGSGKSSGNLKGINIPLGGALTTRGPATQAFDLVLELTFQAEHHTWFQSFTAFRCSAPEGNESSHPAVRGLQPLPFLPLNMINFSSYEAIHIQISLEVECPFICSVYSAYRKLVLWLIFFLCLLCFNNNLPSSIWLWIDGGDRETWVRIM